MMPPQMAPSPSPFQQEQGCPGLVSFPATGTLFPRCLGTLTYCWAPLPASLGKSLPAYTDGALGKQRGAERGGSGAVLSPTDPFLDGQRGESQEWEQVCMDTDLRGHRGSARSFGCDKCSGTPREERHKGCKLTLKKVMVAPSLTAPYSILVCLAKSSAEPMGDSILSTVKKAAKFAV